VRGRLAPENASTAGRTRGPSGRPCVRLSIRCYLPQPACLLQASCALGLAFSHCVIERVSLFDILLFMQVQYLRTTGALWPSSLLSVTQAVIPLVSSAVWRCARAGDASVARRTNPRNRSRLGNYDTRWHGLV